MLHYCVKIGYKTKAGIRFLFITVLTLLSIQDTLAQDPQFSQFYGTSLYLAPSLAGTNGGTKATANYRNQWPMISKGFVSYMMSVDHSITKLNSGVGIMALREVAGSGRLSTTYAGAAYSYDVRLTRKWRMRPGLMASYMQRSINFGGLVMGDQLVSGLDHSVDEQLLQKPRVWKLDFTSSLIFFTNGFWFGSTFKHMTSPNLTFLGTDTDFNRLFSFYTGMRIRVRHKNPLFPGGLTVYPSAQFELQGTNKQLSLGTYIEIRPILFGMRYRGIPVFKTNAKSDALIFIAGYRKDKITISYSYDLTISDLMGIGSWGAHEIVVSYLFNQDLKPRRKPLPCPDCYWKDD